MRKALAQRDAQTATPAALRELSEAERLRSVVVVQDAFTTHYDSAVVLDFVELLQRLGFRPWLAPFRPNGKPQHVLGLLEQFGRTASRNAQMLRELAATGVSLVGVDPSMTLVYRAVYVKALGKDAVPPVALPQEWLAERLQDLPRRGSAQSASWSLLPHCTERTNAPSATADWVKVARHFNVDLQTIASGCCGMAGLYGHELVNRPTSETIYGSSWRPILNNAEYAGRVLATGYSCRCHAQLVDGLHLMHPLQLMLRVVKSATAQTSVPPSTVVLQPEHHEEL